MNRKEAYRWGIGLGSGILIATGAKVFIDSNQPVNLGKIDKDKAAVFPTLTATSTTEEMIQAAQATLTPNYLETNAAEENATSTAFAKTLAAFETGTPTPSPTAQELATNTLVAPSPTPEEGSVDTAIPTKTEKSHFHILPDTGLTVSQENGTVSIDINKFREFFGSSLDTQGKDADGKVVDFTANMFGTPLTEFTLDKSPNWWVNRKQGLGWTSADPIYESLSELSAVGPQHVFEERDGVYRFGVRTEVKDFEKAYAVAAVYRYLIGAHMADSSTDEIITYLSDSTVDGKIQLLWKTMVAQSGYRPVAGKTQESPLEKWPGAAQVFKNEMPNMISDNAKDICETDMAKSNERENQREETHDLDVSVNLEKSHPENDETIHAMDAESEVLIMVTFDNTIDASSPTLSPDGKGKIRVDVITARDYDDQLSGSKAPEDKDVMKIEPANFGRLLNCGGGNAVIATATYTAVFTPGGITIVETPAPQSTPRPGETQVIPTQPPELPTPVSTNIPPATLENTPVGNPTDQPTVEPTHVPDQPTVPAVLPTAVTTSVFG